MTEKNEKLTPEEIQEVLENDPNLRVLSELHGDLT